MPDTFRLCIALGPLAVYLLALGGINLSSRPLVVGGGRDLAALGLALAGMLLVGPVELLLPDDATRVWRGWLWPLLGVMYLLALVLVVQLSRPRLVIYNVSAEPLKQAVEQSVRELDGDARWAGNSVVLPLRRMSLNVEHNPVLRTAVLTASSDDQSETAWRKFHACLAAGLCQAEARPRAWGASLVALAVLLLAGLAWQVASYPEAVTQGLADLLR